MTKQDQKKLKIELKYGVVEITLLPDVAPKHVERIIKLSNEGHHDNVAFHRVIDGFMAQTGDVQFANIKKGWNKARAGTGGSNEANLTAEFLKLSFEQ